MIYVPNIDSNTCYYFLDNTTIVELPNTYSINQEYNARHISIDNHYQTYLKKIFITDSVNCINNNDLTSNYIYRSDIVSILLFFLFFMLLIIWLPYKFASRFWKWLK